MMMNEFTNTITTSTPQLLRLDAADTLSLKTSGFFQGYYFEGSAHKIHFCVNLLAAS